MSREIVPTNERDELPVKGNRLIGAKLAKALCLMVDEAATIQQAAQAAGMSTFAVRQAFERPHVLAFLRKRKQMLRESISAANILRLAQIRDAAENMPAIKAIELLEGMTAEQGGASNAPAAAQPALTINIVNGLAPSRATADDRQCVMDRAAAPLTIDARPLDEPSPSLDPPSAGVRSRRGGGEKRRPSSSS